MAICKSLDIMQKHQLNIKQSYALSQECSAFLQPRECYHNIYKCVERRPSSFFSGKWGIAYGYYTASQKVPNLLVRHCFIIDENNQVIDPTIMLTHDDINELSAWEYFDMKIFENYNDYIKVLLKDKYYDLPKALRPYEQQAQQWAKDNNYLLFD